MAQHAVDEMGVVVDAELVGNGQQQRVCGRNCFVIAEFLDELIRLTGIGLAESSQPTIQVTDLVLAICRVPEERPVQVADDREDASADRDSRLPLMAGGFPGVTEAAGSARPGACGTARRCPR